MPPKGDFLHPTGGVRDRGGEGGEDGVGVGVGGGGGEGGVREKGSVDVNGVSGINGDEGSMGAVGGGVLEPKVSVSVSRDISLTGEITGISRDKDTGIGGKPFWLARSLNKILKVRK